jgi:Asp/Glu/hydantoin racemase
MPPKKLALLHTSATLVPIFEKLCQSKLPGVSVTNLVDDSLIKDVIRHGELRPETVERVIEHVTAAERSGADFIMVTCSSIGPAVEAAASLASVPVLRVDQPMADAAVKIARRIGVVATLKTTLEPTADLVRRRAAAAGREVAITTRLCTGAFDALMSGDAATHDAAVAAALRQTAADVDVVVLAQASMARVVDTLAEAERRVPILTSPPLSVDYLAKVL